MDVMHSAGYTCYTPMVCGLWGILWIIDGVDDGCWGGVMCGGCGVGVVMGGWCVVVMSWCCYGWGMILVYCGVVMY